ncbi:glycosyltransferase, partial [Sphingomonas sp. GM_Shp_2]|uniref:glycosyltransferase n=1 Tax=Sphingomonas sp. GM_Shp_2 TaxID=2937380 RepID=UPI00226A7C17
MTSGLARSSIAICVPVRDEAAALPHLFEAVEALVLPAGGTLTLCLLLDGCRDDSARVAERYRSVARPRVHLAEVERGMPNAGLARRRAMAMAGGADIILTTDADSRPAPDWVEAMLAGLARADVVAGRVVREGDVASLLQDRVERYYDALFALRRMLDPVCWEAPVTHHHASGANLGVRGYVYRTLGG